MDNTWLRYTHLEKLYGYLPGMVASAPAIFGLDRDEYQRVRATFDTRAAEAAEELLADPEFAEAVARLPFEPDQTVLAVGDSITDDLQSWAEILRHVLAKARPDDEITIVNGGLSAHTTAMILRRWPATLASTKPDWVLCALGGNDVTRVGPEPTKPQVSTAESIANLRRLREIAAHVGWWVWITPVPVTEERVAAYPSFTFGQSTWRNEDIAALTEAIHELEDPVVDLSAALDTEALSELQGEDGVHVTLAGQQRITRAVVEALT
ncbi:acyl-CoA thioesterase-1 [Herbihabitans rhizosphaerae]|uniref:Acyl-CoA thioesterase-1 n=1 Tax=Herbihabitans rhizosphaerae TaxID=1872711 RepID=A0A4Q7L513_9PSEU|nr:GDSL-type esterase/lipase family protein [Herbihabitans rhizosphaerae]RZS44729.1 acyl-CoA thioesterase-1 [Herbihabitans rhizosphaerae]